MALSKSLAYFTIRTDDVNAWQDYSGQKVAKQLTTHQLTISLLGLKRGQLQLDKASLDTSGNIC